MPPNATTDNPYSSGSVYDPLLNFSYYPSNSNFSNTDYLQNNNSSAFAPAGGLASDSNPYASDPHAYDFGTSRTNTSTSWLQGEDFSSLNNKSSGNLGNISHGNFLNPETSYLPNLSSVNLDQIRIGDQTMENVLKTFDSGAKAQEYPDINRALNGLNLDSSFTTKKYSNYDMDKKYTSGTYTDLETGPSTSSFKPRYSSFSDNYDRPLSRSSIIKSHQSQAAPSKGPVSFQPNVHFFSSPDNSMANITLPNVDASVLLSDDYSAAKREEAKLNKFGAFKKPSSSGYMSQERDQFLAFAAQQYRILASMNPEMMRAPESVDELADRETFKYWARLLIEERERQARIVLNLQKALTEALSSAAATGPHTLTHLGAASGEAELEEIGRFADLCRRRNNVISDYFQRKRPSRYY